MSNINCKVKCGENIFNKSIVQIKINFNILIFGSIMIFVGVQKKNHVRV